MRTYLLAFCPGQLDSRHAKSVYKQKCTSCLRKLAHKMRKNVFNLHKNAKNTHKTPKISINM